MTLNPHHNWLDEGWVLAWKTSQSLSALTEYEMVSEMDGFPRRRYWDEDLYKQALVKINLQIKSREFVLLPQDSWGRTYSQKTTSRVVGNMQQERKVRQARVESSKVLWKVTVSIPQGVGLEMQGSHHRQFHQGWGSWGIYTSILVNHWLMLNLGVYAFPGTVCYLRMQKKLPHAVWGQPSDKEIQVLAVGSKSTLEGKYTKSTAIGGDLGGALSSGSIGPVWEVAQQGLLWLLELIKSSLRDSEYELHI